MGTEPGKELYSAILRAKRNISAPAKTKKAMYGKYADLESVLSSVEGPLAAEGLFIIQSGIVNESGPATLRTSIVHAETGQSIHSDIPLVSKSANDPQQLGGSITYARRYGITAILSIVADDDDDGNTSSGKQRDGRAQPPQATMADVEAAMEVKGGLDNKLVIALSKEFRRSGFNEDAEMMAEIKAVLGREFGQLAELTEAEAKTAVGHARKVRSGDVEPLTPVSA